MLKRCALVCSFCVSMSLTASFSGRAVATGVVTDPTSLPLLQFADLTYAGGFRLPATSANGDNFAYGGSPLTYNPHSNSLFVGTLSRKIAEVSIPAPVDSASVNDMPFANYVQPFVDPTQGNLSQVGFGPELGGLLVFGGRLYGTGYVYYDANRTQSVSHYSHSLTLSESSFQGMHAVWQNQKAGFVSGYMATVPPEWQALLGGPAVTGQCCIPIVSRTSWGPGAFAWNPADLGTVNPLPATPLVYYTEDHATLGPWAGADTTWGATTEMGGVALIAGTRTALFIGRNGAGPYCYGDGVTDMALAGTTGSDGTHHCYDPTNMYKGPHAYPYSYQVWAYDLNDFAAVKAGTKQPWQVVPYGVWPITVPTAEAATMIGGVGYDAARQIVYFSQLRADQDGYARRPIIHALKITVPASQSTTTTPTPAPAELTTPAPGSTLTAATAQLQWTAGTGVSQYRLSVGTTAGGTQLSNQDMGSALSAALTGLPVTGGAIHVRLASQISGTWQNKDYTYIAATTSAGTGTGASAPRMISPAPGSMLNAATVQFQWTGSANASLSIGTTPGGGDIYTADQDGSLSATVAGLPTNGRTVYVRLWAETSGGVWQRNDYMYTAATLSVNAPAQLTSPAAGAIFTASTVQFQWTAGSGVSKYWLTIGAAPGGEEIYSKDAGTSLSLTASGLPTNGIPLHAVLWSLINGAWKRNDYVFTAAAPGATGGVPAQILTPASGSTFPGSAVQFQWTSGSGVTKYWLTMGAAQGGEEIFSRDFGTSLSGTATSLPANGRPVHVGLWSLIDGKWYKHDYVYVAK